MNIIQLAGAGGFANLRIAESKSAQDSSLSAVFTGFRRIAESFRCVQLGSAERGAADQAGLHPTHRRAILVRRREEMTISTEGHLQAVMGHSSMQMTFGTYGHLFPARSSS